MRSTWRSAVLTPISIFSCISALAACSSSSGNPSNDASAPGHDSGNSGTDGSLGSGDSGGNGDATASGDDAGSSESDGSNIGANDGGTTTLLATIALPAQPFTVAQNRTTGRLYVALADAAGNGQGISVIDMASDTLVTTIAQPSGSTLEYNALAVDEASNRIFATDTIANSVWVFDGATNMPVAPIALDALAPTGMTANGVTGVAVDNTAHVLYAALLLTDSSCTDTLSVAILDPTSGDAGAPLVTTTQVSSTLAVDPQNHLLFVCGLDSSGNPYKTSVSTIDTTSNTVKGTPLTWPNVNAEPVGGCVAIAGTGAWATQDFIQQTSTLHLLEPADITLESGFVPTSISESYVNTSGNFSVTVIGQDRYCHFRSYRYTFVGETQQGRAEYFDLWANAIYRGYTFDGLSPGMDVPLTPTKTPHSGGYSFYITQRPNPCSQPTGDGGSIQFDAGTSPAVLHVNFLY
jgi:hypothetical protein